MKTKPASPMIEVLTPIWQRVLHCSSIHVEANFFDLGGDSLLALELFNEIGQACGRELPPVMIYQAPTLAALAALLEEPTIPPFPPLVLLKAGTQDPPVFITHGLGGSVMDFFQVIRHVESNHPIHGMQAKGIDGMDEPFDSIEGMAQNYLDAIMQLQPHGPYLLIGYSLGGLVTLEMAHRLSEAGEKVALLAMLDTYPHINHLSLGQRTRLLARLVGRHASVMTQLPVRRALSYIFRPSERRLHIPGDSSGSARYQSPNALSPAMQRLRDSAYHALAHYRPRFYRGKVKFVRAEIVTDFPDNPSAVWGKLVDDLEVETIPGDHLGIMTTHFESLARILSRYVREAVCHQ